MKIQSIEKVITTYYYVETDEEDFPCYRTDGKGNWECAMGESWEVLQCEELEKEYRKIFATRFWEWA